MLVGTNLKPIIIFWLLSLLNLLILLQNSCVNTDADLAGKHSLNDVIDEDSKQCIENHDNEAAKVTEETETQEILRVSTIKLPKA